MTDALRIPDQHVPLGWAEFQGRRVPVTIDASWLRSLKTGARKTLAAVDLASEVTGVLPVPNGGTGLSSVAQGDLLHGSAPDVLSRLAKSATASFLDNSGTSNSPAWAAKAALTRSNDTNVTLTLGGSPTTALLAATSLALGWTGTLAPARGGTGLGSYASGDIIYASAANTLSALAKGSDAQVLTLASGLPAWADPLVTVWDTGGETLLNFDGADGSTTFTDEGSSPLTFSANGGAALDTAQKKFGTASLYGAATGDYIFCNSAGALPASGGWTIDFWYRAQAAADHTLFMWYNTLAAVGVRVEWAGSAIGTPLRVYLSSNGTTNNLANGTSGTAALVINTWYHIAITRDDVANAFYLYVDGGEDIEVSSASQITSDVSILRIGNSNANQLGWIDRFRISHDCEYPGGVTFAPVEPVMYPMLAADTEGKLPAHTSPGLTFDPATNTLTADNFSGTFIGNADTVTVANEAADTSCFVLFATAASGAQEPKSNVSLTFNSATGAFGATSVTVGNTGLVVGASTPFSDAAGTLTLQNVDALDATTEATIEAAIDTLANLTSVQGRTVTLADAGANAVFGWDDTAGAYENLTASEVLEIIKTVDGAGSGLDADLLDGNSSAFFATATGLSDHLADTSDAHDASAISVLDTGGLLTATDVEAALAEIATDIDTHIADATAAHAATAVSFSPAGNIAAITVQAAIEELDTEKQPVDGGLTDIAGLAVTDGNIIVGDGVNWVAESGATARASLGLTIGTHVQAWSSNLDEYSAVNPTAYGLTLTQLADETALEALLDTLPNLVSVQGFTVTLADAGADAVLGWDDSAGAYENLTASEVLEIVKTVDGSGSGLDADLLDGTAPTAYGLSLIALADETALEATIDTLPNLVSVQGLTVTLADAGADAFLGWDDSAAAYENLTKAEAQAVLGLVAVSVDNTVPRFDSTGGNQQTSGVVIDDSDRVIANGFLPDANDGAALGASGTAFSDLFLASGAVVDFDAGDVTVTHSAGALTVAGGALVADDQLLVSTGTSISTNGPLTPAFQVNGDSAASSSLVFSRWAVGAGSPFFIGAKSRGGGTVGVHGAVIDGEDLFIIIAEGSDGTGFQRAARILFEAEGTISTGVVPGRVTLQTANASGTMTDAFQIDSSQHLFHYANFTSATAYSRCAFKHASTTLASVSGATVTATGLIPARANLVGVNTKVTVALGTGGGTTGYQVGDGTDADRWGTITGTSTNTDTDGNNATADPAGIWATTARDVVITANGGNFNGTGSIRVDAFYTITEAD